MFLEKEWFIQAPWGRIGLIAWGNCYDTPVLAVHGGLDSAAAFRPLVKLLPQKYYYIAIDLPGHGKSDALLPGGVLSLYDYVYAINVVVRHFRWQKFIMMVHSFSAAIANTYNMCYPGKISKLIQIEPFTFKKLGYAEFPEWYQRSFGAFFDNFDMYSGPSRKLKREEALQNLMKTRQLPLDCAEATLERMTIPTGDGCVRYTYDRRIKILHLFPLSPEQYKQWCTKFKTPTLTVLAKESLDKGIYNICPFITDEKAFPHGNCKVVSVVGNHDVHFANPETVAPFVTEFLLNDNLKAKL